jgi:hypothetical protein
MSEITITGISVFIGVLTGFIGAYVALKSKFSNIIEDNLPIVIKELEDYLHSTDGQRTFYEIGLLIGNGAKAGVGLSPAGKSPKGLMGLVSQFLPNILGGLANQAQGQPQPPQETGGSKW